jgi:hypothetical protein
MMETTHLNKTLIVNSSNQVDVVRRLLADGWRKKEALVFFRDRNNYRIEINGKGHPMWNVTVVPKTSEFDEFDWKLRQDMKKLNNIGSKNNRRKLYVNDQNRNELKGLISTMKQNNYSLIFNNEFIVFRTKANEVKVFKVAAAMDLAERPDGWYAGQKKIL